MIGLRRDLHHAARGLRRTPVFTATVLATLAIGIGATAAIFSVVNGVLLRALPFGEADRVVAIEHAEPYWQVSEGELMDYRRDLGSAEHVAAYTEGDANLTDGSTPIRVRRSAVTDRFFDVLGVAPALGRLFTPGEEGPGTGPSVAVISHGLWQGYFGGNADVVGRTMRVNGAGLTVVGVMPAAFDFPSRETGLWQPLRLNPDSLWGRNNHYMKGIARLRPGVPVAQASAQAATLARRWSADFPDIYHTGQPLVASVRPIADAIVGTTRPYLIALLGSVSLVLLIACANVANLLLVRADGRRRELGIRRALGASGHRLATQLFGEAALLAGLGGLLGIGVAAVAIRLLLASAPDSIPRLHEVGLDAPVLVFTLTVSVLTGLLFGLWPALRAAREDQTGALRESGKASAAQGRRGARSVLVIAEVTLAAVVLVSVGLLARSLAMLERVDLGFEPSRVLALRIHLPPDEYREPVRAVAFIEQLERRLAALPGVRAVATMGHTPMTGGGDGWSIMLDGRILSTVGEAPVAMPQQVTPGYFAALGIPIVRGRGFTGQDNADAPPVTVVNETMARSLWPGQDPVGRTLRMFGGGPWVTVVGVAADIHSWSVERDPPPTMHFPYAQAARSAYYTPPNVGVAIQTEGPPADLAVPARQILSSLDRNVPISDVRTMEQMVGASFASRRFATRLLGSFAAVAMVLAGIGIYGVISYGVSQRRYEIGLRMALGAPSRSVLRLVLGEGVRLAVAGVVIGFAGAIGVAYLIRSLLVGVSMGDPVTYAAVALALAGVAALASLIPARRAASVSPTEALRGD